MKSLLAALLATLLLTSSAFAWRPPETQPAKPEPEGPDVQLHQTTARPPSGLDDLTIR